MGLEIVFGKGRWMYWTILVAVLIAAGIILARRKSPEETARIRLEWGDRAMDAYHFDQAIAFYNTAIENDPTLYGAYFNLALAYEFEDDDKALAAWDKYLEVAADEPSQEEWLAQARDHRSRLLGAPHYTRGLALAKAGDYEGARAEYEAALKWDAENLEILRKAAENETAAGNYAAAVAYYERALGLAPYSMNIRYELGLVYEETDKAKAAAMYRELLEMSSTRVGIKTEKLKDAQRRHAALAREGYRG